MLRCRHHRERRGAQEDGADHRRAAGQGRPRLPPARFQQACARGKYPYINQDLKDRVYFDNKIVDYARF